MSTQEHWDGIYGTRPRHELGWYEPVPSTLATVVGHSSAADSVIDVGGGDSRLVDELLDRGYRDLTVLDLSGLALTSARERLGSRAEQVAWIQADVTSFVPTRTWDLWHDRAVFHFLVTEDDRAAYRAVAAQAVAPSGTLVIATFSRAGPDHCAGLPVCRHDLDSLRATFAPEFQLVSGGDLAPAGSPEGDQRPYVEAVLTRVTT